ncbi:hypothetical protein QZH41_018844, partial [Actinostola sp. cb2023]
MGLFIGPWTDTVGRKPALLLSTLGAALESLMVIGIMSFRWPLRLLLLGKVLNGMTGFLSSMAQAAFVYVSDSTDKSHIPTRLAVLQLVLFTGGFIGQAFSGVFMSAFGFIRPYVGILLCFLASFFYCLLVVPESLELPNQPGTLTSLFNIQSLKRVFTVFTTPRPSTKRRNLIILVLIDSLFYCISVGANGVLILYLLRSPVCLSSTGLGAFFAFKFVTEGLGGIVGVVVLRKFLREENVYRVGFVSLGLGFLCLALVQNQYMAFL